MNEIVRPPSRDQYRNAPQGRILEAVQQAGAAFDADVWHVLNERDNSLIANEIIHGAGSSKFVYQFNLNGTQVAGISVVGARHLAAHYGGIKHRMVATMQKTGALFTFTSYPAENIPMSVSCSVLPELESEPDFFQAVVELSDVKKGNVIQMEKRENRFERRRDGTSYERPHYSTIAQSKAYRNGVLALIPQDVQIEWQQQMVKLGKSDLITQSVIEEKRANVLRFAASKAIAVDRHAVEALTMDQIAGLSDAAREGKLPAFTAAAQALGMTLGGEPESEPERKTISKPISTKTEQPKQQPAPEKQQEPEIDVYLSDAYGEPAEWHGRQHFSNPIAFAEALMGLWLEAPADQKDAIRENNADGIADASNASDRAKLMLEQITPKKSAPLTAEPTAAPTGKGIDINAYIKSARESIAALDQEEHIASWERANQAAFSKFPQSKKLEIAKILAERRAALKPSTPTEQHNGDAERRGRLYLGDIRVSNSGGLDALQKSTFFQACLQDLDSQNADLKEAIINALQARRDQLAREAGQSGLNLGQ